MADVVDERLAAVTLARRIIAVRMTGAAAAREDYPGLSDDEWRGVEHVVTQHHEQINPSEDDFVAAYEYLTGETP